MKRKSLQISEAVNQQINKKNFLQHGNCSFQCIQNMWQKISNEVCMSVMSCEKVMAIPGFKIISIWEKSTCLHTAASRKLPELCLKMLHHGISDNTYYHLTSCKEKLTKKNAFKTIWCL